MANRNPKGDQRRTKILSRALEIAARKGLAELTIGGLAKELKMSKSGLFAHFGSKQSLALATIDRASEIFREEVILPVQDNKEGLERLWNLCDLWLEHMERGISR